MTNDIRVLADLELTGAISFANNLNDFPLNPKPRTIVVKEGQAYIYTELANGSGYYTWQPIGVRYASHLHTQGVESTTWVATHGFGSTDFAYFVYDNNHRLILANVEIVDSNTVKILLTQAMTGTAVFFSVDYLTVPAITASDSVAIKNITLRDAQGVLTVNNNPVAMAAAVAAAVSQVENSIAVETTRATGAEAALSSRIDNVLSNTDTVALNSLSELVTAFQEADGNLTTSISSMATNAASALATEVTARQSAVTTLTNNLAAEANRAQAAEATNATAITTEAAARATAVTAAIATAATDATTKVAAEANRAQAAEATNATAITAEETRAKAAEAANAAAIATEATRAQAAEATNATAVTAAIATAATDATTKVAAEATARDSAIATAITTEVTNRNSAITAGVVASAAKLTTARAINGASFDGTANISFNTSNVAEGTNLYYTDARAKAAITAGTGITVTGGVVATTITQYTDALATAAAKAAISVSGSLAYNSTTGVISYTTPVTTVAGRTGAVTLTSADVGLSNVNNTADSVKAVASATTAGTVTTAAQPNITSVGTLTSLTTSGDVTVGGNLTVSGTTTTINSTTVSVNDLNMVLANNASTAAAANGAGLTVKGANATMLYTSGTDTWNFNKNIVGTLNGSATTAGTVTTAAQPNITSVGTLTSLAVSGALTSTSITTGANTTAGTITGNWSLSAGSKLSATYADLAEKYVADAQYEPGTVLVFGGDHEVTVSAELNTTRVAGVVTTNAAYTMNSALEAEYVAEIALQGRVPCKVIGPVQKGDLMVAADNGHAIVNNEARAGTIIGKSLENFTGASGVIEVAVGRF